MGSKVKFLLTAGLALAGGALFAAPPQGRVALHTWATTAEFKDISVTDLRGTVLWKGLPNLAKAEKGNEGKWVVDGDVLRQTNEKGTQGATLAFGSKEWGDYVFRVKARKLSGKEGFILHVRELGPQQCIYANYGGWNNAQSGFETRGDYDFPSPMARATDAFETGRWYDLEVVCKGKRLTMKVDGKPIYENIEITDRPLPDEPNVIVVDDTKAKYPVAEDMWGIFFEDIDLSLDGGVYAELVRNRSFEDGEGRDKDNGYKDALGYWETVGDAELTIDTTKPLSDRNRQCGRVKAQPGAGIANTGYFGIAVKPGEKYRLSVALRGDLKGPIDVSLAALGATYAKGQIKKIGPDWKTYTLEFTANAVDPAAKLVFRAPGGGTFYIDCVSLFPCDTYGKSGLFRKDLMERLAALKPSFVRFPGGCWVEGDTMAEAYRWKKTIGSIWDRRTQWNIWRYWSTNGVGFHEYLQLCEDLGATAMFCINCGMSHRENAPMDQMDEFVQDALDCIEYANGPATSKWGKVRAANGHPEPFNLKYLEIGNENGGPAYHERYALIHDAVQKRYPEIKIISDLWGGPVKGRPQHIRDEHYYMTPDWFMSQGAKHYDQTPRGEFEVFVGEYAVTQDVGHWGDLRAAIGEAAFMCGLERNADLVKLAAYAPLFANAKHTVWSPNLIYPTTDGNFVNPSWNVQKLFSENRGKDVLAFEQTSRVMRTKDGRSCRAVAASAVRDADGTVIVKAVNCSEKPQDIKVSIAGAKVAQAKKTWFTGPDAKASNSPTNREALKEKTGTAKTQDGVVVETLPPFSLTVFRLKR